MVCYLTVMKFFVSVLIGIDMSYTHSLQGKFVWGNSAWGEYVIQPIGSGEDTQYKVLNGKGEQVNVVWATLEGATACAELLAEGMLQE